MRSRYREEDPVPSNRYAGCGSPQISKSPGVMDMGFGHGGNQIRPWAGTEHKAGRGSLPERRLGRRVCLRTWSTWLDMTTISQIRRPRERRGTEDATLTDPTASLRIPSHPHLVGPLRRSAAAAAAVMAQACHNGRTTGHRCSVPSWSCLCLGPRRHRSVHGARLKFGGESTRSESRCRRGRASSSGDANYLQHQELVPPRPVDQLSVVIWLDGGLIGWTRFD